MNGHRGLKHAAAVAVAALLGAPAGPAAATEAAPGVVFVTVDTLRTDRLSVYGYERATSPHIDELLRRGVRFTQARTVEPLTNPALSSMLTTLPPHEHGATRNGLRMREGLDSIGRILGRRGWRTAAFVGSWTLKDRISRMAEHFEDYHEVLTRRRWFGMLNREADARDVTDDAAEWVERHMRADPDVPFVLWAHYVEPHAPYRFHKQFAARLGVPLDNPGKSERYDTEVAFVDAEVGRLLKRVEKTLDGNPALVVFASDHGESLGEHGYWGHGRHLFEPTLSIPMGITWSGHIEPQVVDAPAVISDLVPTVLDLVEVPVPENFRGFSWAQVLNGADPPPRQPLCYQAHRGAVKRNRDSEKARSRGLLAVAVVDRGTKEILLMRTNERLLFDLEHDPGELQSLVDRKSDPSETLMECVGEILQGLEATDRLVPDLLDRESRDKLKELGYIE